MFHACMQSKPPAPSNEAVFLSEAPAFTAYVASYSGWNSEKRFTQVAAELFEELKASGVSVREDMYYTAGYDSPFRLVNRHNEVCLTTSRLFLLILLALAQLQCPIPVLCTLTPPSAPWPPPRVYRVYTQGVQGTPVHPAQCPACQSIT